MAIPNSSLTEIVTTTLRQRQKTMADNVTNNNALLTRLKEKGKIITVDGGRTLVEPLSYAENGNYQWYNGYEVLNISPTDMITAAEYEWKQAASNVSISGLEMRQNNGGNAIIDLLRSRIDITEATIKNQISAGIYSDGTGSGGKEIGGLELLVADDPTTGTVGGIDRSANTFWRNSFVDYGAVSATSSANVIPRMNDMYNTLVRGNDAVDLIVGDLNYFGFYQDALQTQQRFANPDSKLAAAGFMVLKYANADVVLENSNISTNHMYFLNTDYMNLAVHSQANMTVQESKSSVNQDAMVIPVLWMGNMRLSNASLQGVIFE